MRLFGIWERLAKDNNLFYYALRSSEKDEDFRTINQKQEKNIFNTIKTIRDALKKEKIDYILAEDFRGALLAYASSHDVPFVWRQYGTTLGSEIKNSPISIKTLSKIFLYKLLTKSKKCTGIIVTLDGCLNKFVYEKILKTEKSKLYYIKNPKITHAINVKPDKDGPEFIICQLGRINHWKKVHIAISGFSKFIKKIEPQKDVKFIIAGTNDDKEYIKKLEKHIFQENISNYVEFMFNLNKDQVAEVLSKSHASISLTAYSPIIESLSVQTPVIAYNWGEVDEQFHEFSNVKIIGNAIRKDSLLSEKEEDVIADELHLALLEFYRKTRDRKDNLSWEKDAALLEESFPTLNESIEIGYNLYCKAMNLI